MYYNKYQRQMIKSLIKYKPKGTEESFEKPLKNYFKTTKKLKNVNIEIQNDKVTLTVSAEDYKKKYNEKYMITLEILITLNSIIDDKLILFVNHDKNETDFKLNNNNNNKDKIIIEYDNKKLIKALNKKWIISNDLIALKRRCYRTVEGWNLLITQIALGTSIVLGILGIFADYFIANKVPTTVNFEESLEVRNSKENELELIELESRLLKLYKFNLEYDNGEF